MNKLHSDREIFAAEANLFNLLGYGEQAENCEVTHAADVPLDSVHRWRSAEHPLGRSYENGYYHIRWEGHSLEALHLSWPDGRFSITERTWLVAETELIAKEFYRAVLTWASEIKGEVLVFHGGCWSKDRGLFKDISNHTRENLILAKDLKETIWRDFSQFFSSRELYEQHKIPWKRGVLFNGPPGNGKSHTVKALVNDLGVPCLYVKSLKNSNSTEHSSIRAVFKRARDTTPCVLVFEDLDSHIHVGNRSFFLNEMDGFAANEGILTLATCNYPERLDPAILERPSRFDRKYQFDLPGPKERLGYLTWWSEQLEKELKLDEAQLGRLAKATDGFSFAYLRELVLSSMMDWINLRTEMHEVMQAQVATLAAQMKSTSESLVNRGDDQNPDHSMLENLLRDRGL